MCCSHSVQRFREMEQEVDSLCINVSVCMLCPVEFRTVTSVSLLQCPWRNVQLESEVEFVLKIVHTIRSARSDYNLPNKVLTEGTL
jgi:hypothetical protein